METKIYELEKNLVLLGAELKLKIELKEDISKEIRQNLYDKFDEFLIKGYSIDFSISRTLEEFEDPKKLAGMFNSAYNEHIVLDKAIGFIYDRKFMLVAIVASLLMAFAI
jgi:hypothetical protein